MATRHNIALNASGQVLARIGSGLRALHAAWERRQLVGQLGALDDHMLRDIGITRQDVLSVLAEPMFRDPSQKLAERARDVRQANRAAALDSRAFSRTLNASADKASFGSDRRAA